MSEITTLSTTLGLLGTACAIAFGYATYKRNRRCDDAGDGKESGIILTEIGYIKSGVDDIKRRQEKQDAQYVDVVVEITALKESSKQAHHRINRLEAERQQGGQYE